MNSEPNSEPNTSGLILARVYLAVVGLLYIVLALWCSIEPKQTSQQVGFTLNGDSGSSEFITIYGGLEFGMALIFLLPLIRAEATRFALLNCLVIHGSLVVFRAATLLIYRDVGATTAKLAIGEWVIFLLGLVLLAFFQRSKPEGQLSVMR